MTPDQAVKKMKEIADKYKHDPEAAHAHADKLLCDILRASGYYDTADAFEKMKKHYG